MLQHGDGRLDVAGERHGKPSVGDRGEGAALAHGIERGGAVAGADRREGEADARALGARRDRQRIFEALPRRDETAGAEIGIGQPDAIAGIQRRAGDRALAGGYRGLIVPLGQRPRRALGVPGGGARGRLRLRGGGGRDAGKPAARRGGLAGPQHRGEHQRRCRRLRHLFCRCRHRHDPWNGAVIQLFESALRTQSLSLGSGSEAR